MLKYRKLGFNTIEIIGFSEGMYTTNLIIPEEIKGMKVNKIGDEAFRRKKIESVKFPEGLKIIGESAFWNNEIKEVILPNTVEDVKDQAFSYNKIETLKLSESMHCIRDSVFRQNKLTEIKIPENIIEIEQFAFANNLLTEIEIPASVFNLRGLAFNFNKIKKITAPNFFKRFGEGVFYDNDVEDVIFEKRSLFKHQTKNGITIEMDDSKTEHRFAHIKKMLDGMSRTSDSLERVYFEGYDTIKWDRDVIEVLKEKNVSVYLEDESMANDLLENNIEVIEIDSRESFWKTVRFASMF